MVFDLLWLSQNGYQCADDIFYLICLTKTCSRIIQIPLKFGPKDLIDSVVLDDGLAPDNLQAIIWTNDDLF